MSSLQPTYLATLVLPPRVAGILRRLGEHTGRQELYRRQAPEMLENLRRILADLQKAGSLECLNRGRWAKWRNKGNEAG